MTLYPELIQKVDAKLAEFHYANDPMITVPDVVYISYIQDRSIFKVKNLCAMVDMPENIVHLSTAQKFFMFLKKCLLEQYGDAFLWKELEICFIVLCSDELYSLIKEDNGRITNEASFSLSALLGTCFINVKTFDVFSVSTWGIFFSGDHFKAIDKIVQEWSVGQKSIPEG